MYILTHKRLGPATQFLDEMNIGLYPAISQEMGRAVLQKFGPTAVQKGLPFELTDEQLKDVLAAVLFGHPANEEVHFCIHRDRHDPQTTYKIGPPHLYPGGNHTAKFNFEDAITEASKLTSEARRTKGSSAPYYVSAGYAHSHPRDRNAPNGIPSDSDLRVLTQFRSHTDIVTMVIGEGSMPKPETIDKRISRSKALPRERHELDASVIWRSPYIPPVPLNLSFSNPGSHQAAAAAVHGISPNNIVFRYFKGKIVYDNGGFSTEFVELP